MHPADIKAALAKANSSGSCIAKALQCAEPTVSAIIRGKSRSRRIEQRIAEITDLPLSQLWPQWYSPAPGTPDDREISVAGFRARLIAELDRLELPTHALVGITEISHLSVASWREEGGDLPTVAALLRLAQCTRLDLAYLMTGRREVAHG